MLPVAVTAVAVAAALAYHPAGDRPAPSGDRILWAEAGAALAHWERVGYDVKGSCPSGIALHVATNLDGDGERFVHGRGEGCHVWLAAWELRSDRWDLRQSVGDWGADRETIREECAEVTHEFGHAIGLQHTTSGIMAPVAPAPTPECRRLARRLVGRG